MPAEPKLLSSILAELPPESKNDIIQKYLKSFGILDDEADEEILINCIGQATIPDGYPTNYEPSPSASFPNEIHGYPEVEALKLKETIAEFPQGVGKNVLLRYFKGKYGHHPKYKDYNGKFVEFCEMFKDVFAVSDNLPHTRRKLIFSSYWLGLMRPIGVVMATLWHYIKVCVNYNGGCLSVDKVLKNVNYYFNITIKPTDWGFKSDLRFLQYLIHNISPEAFFHIYFDTVIKKTMIYFVNEARDEAINYLIRKKQLVIVPKPSSFFDKDVDMATCLNLKKHAKSTETILSAVSTLKIPKHYSQQSQRLDYMSNNITSASKLVCKAAYVHNLSSFYVNVAEQETMLMSLEADLRHLYNRPSSRETTKPDPETLIPGMVVAVVCDGIEKKSVTKVVRGQIIRALSETLSAKSSFEIFLVDSGHTMQVCIDNLFYLPKSYLDNLPAQAIECRALVSQIYDDSWFNNPSQQEEAQMFKDIIQNASLVIGFVGVVPEPITRWGEDKKWFVHTHVVDKKDTNIFIRLNVERIVIAEVEGIYLKSEN